MAEYRTKRDKYMNDHPVCEFPYCDKKSTDLHHMAGRIGNNLTDETKFKALCRPCRRWVEENPIGAKELGLSMNRL